MWHRCALLVVVLPLGGPACETSPVTDGTDRTSSAGLVAASPDLADVADVADGGEPPEPVELSVPDRPDPEALEELVRAAPAKHPPSTGLDGGSLVGSKTDSPASDADDAPEPEASAQAPKPKLVAGHMEVLPAISNPAMESAAREQFYWPLVQKCRGPDGEILPPDTITLSFTIRRDGSVNPATVNATANDKRYEPAAECVVQEFSALSFTPPPAAVGNPPIRIISTLPSVD